MSHGYQIETTNERGGDAPTVDTTVTATTTSAGSSDYTYSVVHAYWNNQWFERNAVEVQFETSVQVEVEEKDGKPVLYMIDADGRALAAALTEHYRLKDEARAAREAERGAE